MLLRHKLALKNRSIPNSDEILELLMQYIEMFKEVATLTFDIKLFLNFLTEAGAT